MYFFFFSIRSQSNIIHSFYNVASSELNRSLTFTAEEIIQYFKTNNTNKPKIKRLVDGFKYWELYKNCTKAVGENNINFFLYEKLKFDFDNFIFDLSNYLKIDSAISNKLLKNNSENRSIEFMKENSFINSPLSILCFKLIKNFKNPKNLFENFNKKLLNMFKLSIAWVAAW